MENGYQQNQWQQGQNPQYQGQPYQQPQYQNPGYQQPQYQGQPYQQPQYRGQPYQQPQYQPYNPQPVDDYKPIPVGQVVSMGEYRRHYTPKSFRKQVRTTCIVGYVFTGINLIMAIAFNPFVFIDVVILLGLLLGIHLGKSKGCAIGMIVYSTISMILSLAQGTFGGWLWLAVGVGMLITFNKVDQHYKEVIAGRYPGYM
ncbi:MAG: hypothetical protein IJX69_03935 [Oscillospiraceae bacterium]|nr:hypothetical protein [Oscillospiraceae bacterium]